MSKMYGLFYVGNDRELQRLVSVSESIDKLTSSCPTISTWLVQNDPNDKTLKRIGKSVTDPSKFLIREINHIV